MAWIAAASLSAADAPHYVVRTWQSDEGLPDNSVMGVGQTPDGFLWVATQTGLSRFDGVQFREFPVMSSGVPSDRITKLLADRRGRLWIAKEVGAVVCVEHGRATAVGIPELGESSLGLCWGMTEDAAGAVWLCYSGGAVVRIQDGQVRLFTGADGLPERGFCKFTVDGKGRLWFAKDGWVGVFREGRFCPLEQMPIWLIAGARSGGIWCYLANHTVCKYTEEGARVTVPQDMPALTPTALHEDRQGLLWLGTREKGLFRLDRAGAAEVVLAHPTILNIMEDREENLWVGTRGGGLCQVKPRTAELLATGTGVPLGGVRSVCQDTAGQLWAVIWPNGEVMRSKGQAWSPLTASDGWSVQYAKCVAADTRGGVWIGTEYAGLHRWQDGVVTDHFENADGLGVGMVNALWVTGSGALWIGTGTVEEQPQVLQCLEDKKFQTFNLSPGSGRVVVVTTDAAGGCWAATSRGRLLRVSKGVLTDETAKTLGSPAEIRCLLGPPDGSLWIGTGRQGLGRLKDGRFSRCQMAQGLRDDTISNMLPDGFGRLWFAGNRGIFSVREQELNDFMDGRSARVWSAAYGRNEGMLRLQASYDSCPGAVRGTEDRLFFAMQSGLAVVHAAQVKADQKPPPVLIEQVKVNGKIVAAYGLAGVPAGTDASSLVELGPDNVHLLLAPGRRQVEFAFTALSFIMPETLGFRYRLQGFDTEWNEAGTRRSAAYRQLPPGNYRFEVTACNSDGLWNKTGAGLELTVEPFWWETAWFRLLAAVLLLGAVWGIARYWQYRKMRLQVERVEREGAIERERARIARDLHDEIGAKLTRLSLLGAMAAEDADKGGSLRAEIQEMTGTAREAHRAFDEIVWSVNPRNDTVRSLAHYICKYAEEFFAGAAVTCRFHLPDTMPDQPLLPPHRYHLFLAVKEGLNNILKHACATEVEVAVTLPPGRLSVELADNGRGFDPDLAGSQGNGLRNMRERMKMTGGLLTLTSSPTAGTRLVFTMPLEDRKPKLKVSHE